MSQSEQPAHPDEQVQRSAGGESLGSTTIQILEMEDPIYNGLRIDTEGLCSLCNDGVLRSFSAPGQVVDYRKLSPEEIKSVIRRLAASPVYTQEAIEKLRSIFNEIDGRDVDDSKCENPDPEDIPDTCIQNQKESQGEGAKDA